MNRLWDYIPLHTITPIPKIHTRIQSRTRKRPEFSISTAVLNRWRERDDGAGLSSQTLMTMYMRQRAEELTEKQKVVERVLLRPCSDEIAHDSLFAQGCSILDAISQQTIYRRAPFGLISGTFHPSHPCATSDQVVEDGWPTRLPAFQVYTLG